MPRYLIRITRRASLVAIFVGIAILGTVSGVLFAFAGDLPQITALDDYAPSVITRVHAANGEVVTEFATQRRVVIAYKDITPPPGTDVTKKFECSKSIYGHDAALVAV